MTVQQPYEPTTSYLSTVVYSGNGSTTTFAYNFDYLNKDTWAVNSPNDFSSTYNAYLRLIVNNVAVPYKMTNSYTLVAETAPASGTDNVRIVRDSSLATRKVDYVEGSTLTESNLDRDSKQAFFLIQELHDRAIDLGDWAVDRFVNSYYYTANGSTTNFDLNLSASNNLSEETTLLDRNDILVFLNGTLQQSRATVYTTSLVGGVTRVTLASAPVNGTLVEVRTLSTAISQRVTLQNDDVTTSIIADGAVTWPKTDFDGAGSNGTFLQQVGGAATWATPTSASISGFDTAVRTSRLDQMAAPNTSVSLNSQKITNLATPTNSGDAATKGYVDGILVANSPNLKIVKQTITSTGNTVTGASWTPTHLRVTLVRGQLDTSGRFAYSQNSTTPTYTTVYPKSEMFLWSEIGTAQTWNFAAKTLTNPTSLWGISIQSSGNNLTVSRVGESTSTGFEFFFEFIKQN